MTIEEKFFKTFGIEPKKLFSARQGINPDAVIYPKITDRKLLLLICIANAHSIYGYSDYGGEFLIGTTIEKLKENLLKDLLDNASRVREDVKALFEEEE